MGTPVTMFAPDGSTGEIPADKVAAAQQAGFKRAVSLVAPDGKTSGYVPEDKVNEATQKGFRFGTADKDQPSTWEQYKQALFNPVGSGAHDQGVVGGLEQVGGRAMQGIVNTVAHPLDTIAGTYQAIRHPVDTVTARADEFKQEWQKDPALALENAAGDVSGTIEGGRLGSAVAGKVLPVATKLAGRAVLLGKTPEAAYESALKPSTVLSQSDRAAAVQTGLQQGIPISKGGLEMLGDKIDTLNQAIKDEIAKDPNRPIDPQAVAARTGDTVKRFSNQVNATPDLEAINNSRDLFLKEQGATPGNPAPPMGAADAQAMKQGTYSVLKGKFGEQGSASVEAQKALARGLKEEIATQFPEIGKLNAQESQLLDLQPILEQAVNRISNHQLIGIGTPVAGAAAKAVTGSSGAGAVASVLKAALDNPMVKSRLAIAISKGAKIPYSDALSKVGAYSLSLGSTSALPQESSPAQSSTQQ